MDIIEEIKENAKLLITIAYRITDSLEHIEESINKNSELARCEEENIRETIKERKLQLDLINMALSKLSKTNEGFNFVYGGKIYSVKEQ